MARSRPALAVVFGLSIAAVNYFYYEAIARLPIAVAITVQSTAPALVVVYVLVYERRVPSRRVVVTLALATVGVALLAELPAALGGTSDLAPAGLAAALGSAVAFAAYMVSGERLGRNVGADHAVFRGFVVASMFWACVQLVRGRPDTLLDASFIPGIFVLAIGTTLVPFLLFLWGLGHVDASRAGITSTLEPLTATVLAFVWLGQTLGALQLAGAAMVIVGVASLQLERPQTAEVLAERAVVE